ncbi:MAG: hydrogenase maturation protease [Calditrichaeota bacterium]|nr:hydrogenase maturation protease [Calditrichota bacterium]
MGDHQPHTLVVGVGNVLLADEGVGVHMANLLQAARLPRHVRVVECGTNFMAVATQLEGAGKVVIIDAVRAGSEPGTIHRLTYEELERANAGLRFAHQVSLLSSLRLLRVGEPALARVEVVLLGVEPATVAPGMEMSPPVRAALPRLMEAVRAEL